MTTATQRLFARIEARYDNVDFAAHYTLGALKGYMEILAEKFPEVEQHIASMEDFMEQRVIDTIEHFFSPDEIKSQVVIRDARR